jgi:hypothetical protein
MGSFDNKALSCVWGERGSERGYVDVWREGRGDESWVDEKWGV